jgi:nicotinamidase-related amidase
MQRAVAHILVAGVLSLAGSMGSTAVRAGTIIDDWASVKPEPAPELKPVTVEPKTTALLVMELVKGGCNNDRRPRCVASIPAIAKLLGNARAKGMTVIHTLPGTGSVADILSEVAPKADEKVVTGTQKFLHTDLEKSLKDKGATTVIIVGTAAHSAVFYASREAAYSGFKVIVPVDGASSENLFAEQATAWLLTHAPGLAAQTTLTKTDMMKF